MRFTLIQFNRLITELNQRILYISRGAVTTSQHLHMVAIVQAVLAMIDAMLGNHYIVEGLIERRIGLERIQTIIVGQRQPLNEHAIHHHASLFTGTDVVATLVVKKIRLIVDSYQVTIGVLRLRCVAVDGEQFKL